MTKNAATSDKWDPLQVGTYQTMATRKVKPNVWNPNRMSAETYQSLRYGLENDGWIGQPLIVLGRDDAGEERNIIIDGEHRWRVAKEIGFKTVPCFVLDGMSEAKAKSLTIAMNQRRGEFDADGLRALLASIQDDIPDLALATGIGDKDLAVMLNAARIAGEAAAAELGVTETPELDESGPTPERTLTRTGKKGVEATQETHGLAIGFVTEQERETFEENIRTLARQHGTTGLAETLIVSIQHAADALR